ncbi:MAG TPA: response regulator transcription factor [Kofleriaceae bacterium]|nr:response regulator transcription factor [Kofleriaceae bacterium]
MIKVVIAEDHTLVREAMVWLFQRSKKVDVVGEAATGTAAVSMTKRHRPDVLVLDLTMPEKDGLQVLDELAQLQVATRTLVVTMHEDEAHGLRAMRAGAAGLVHKSAGIDELISAVERVHRGEHVVPQAIQVALARKRSEHPTQVLSPREFQVLGHLAAGMNHHEIADALSISVKTVDTHRSHVLKKLRLRNNADLTRFAIANDLMSV